MSYSLARRLSAAAGLVAVLLSFPAGAAAVITGGCTGEGHATSGNVNLTTATEWHIKRDDVGGGSGTAPAPIRAASVSAYAAGVSIPIAGGTSEDGETTGSVENVSASTLAILGSRFIIAGSASGDATCNGQITIIIDEVNPLLTLLGGGGLLLALVGLLAIIMGARSDAGWGSRILAFVLGGLGGLGLGLALEQFGILDPTQPIGLGIAVIAAVLGLLLAGRLGSRTQVAPL
jgi:hypothetical protein